MQIIYVLLYYFLTYTHIVTIYGRKYCASVENGKSLHKLWFKEKNFVAFGLPTSQNLIPGYE